MHGQTLPTAGKDDAIGTASASSHPLWAKLLEFQFDETGEPSAFTARLARENEWSPRFAERVIFEYKRFLFLAAVAGPVAPSDSVDQAWHLHLLYTRSYWERLCAEVLKFKLHHDPAQGGAGEKAKLENWYASTLSNYLRFFDAEPPGDIWPRSQPRKKMRRIDVTNTLMIPLPGKLLRRRF